MTVPNDVIVVVPVICAKFPVRVARFVVDADAIFVDFAPKSSHVSVSPALFILVFPRFNTSSCISLVVSAVTVRVTIAPEEKEKAVVPGVLLASSGRQVQEERTIVSVSPVFPVTFTISLFNTAYGATVSTCFISSKYGKVLGNLPPCPDCSIIVSAIDDIQARSVHCALFCGTKFCRGI